MEIGDVFTRDELKDAVEAGGDDYILTSHGEVVAVALNPRLNPDAPEIVIVGTGPRIEKRAHQYLDTRKVVPVFVKRAVDEWVFVGDFRASSLDTSTAAIERHRHHRPKESVYGILFLKRAAMRPSTIFPEEQLPDKVYPEGAIESITVNKYERSQKARAACIDHHGSRCQICGFDFGLFYGPLGEGYIHVHHIVPLSETGGEYRCDPIRDLLPVCANCHGMLHLQDPALRPDELREMLKRQGESLKALKMKDKDTASYYSGNFWLSPCLAEDTK